MKIDLSHIIEDGMVTYKGLPAPVICDFWSREYSAGFYQEGESFQIGKIEMVANTGTYIDAPFHRFADGIDMAELHLDTLADVEGVLVDASKNGDLGVDESWFQYLDLAGKAVLIRTDWSRHWRTEQYFKNHPFLTRAAAEFMVQAKVKLVGIDSYNIDDTRYPIRPVHTALLGANIPIVEHLCGLQEIPFGKSFRFTAVPPKIKGLGSFPVRAFVTVEM